jgi:hypothetical protein
LSVDILSEQLDIADKMNNLEKAVKKPFYKFCLFSAIVILELPFKFFGGKFKIPKKFFCRHEFQKKSRMTIAENLQKFRKKCKAEFHI